MKTINLDKLFDNNFNCYYGYDTKDEEPAMNKTKFKEVSIILAKKILKLAAKNAKTKNEIVWHHTFDGNIQEIIQVIDEQSILDTINNIEL